MNQNSKIEGLDYVVCQICSKHLKQINNLHLRIHNISINEYRKKYPNCQITPIKKNKLMSKLMKKLQVNGGFGTGYKHNDISKQKIRDRFLGIPKTPEHCQHICDTHQSMKGNKNPNWKGGISTKRNLFISSDEYKQWRTSIFERDNYTCQECNIRGGSLNSHHILPYRHYPEFGLRIENGITLCEKCHKETFGKEYEYWGQYFDKVNLNKH